MHTEEINKARGFFYNLFSLLFVEEHTKEQLPAVLENLTVLKENAFDEDVAKSASFILEFLANKEHNTLYKHYQDLFLVPFGNHVSLSSSLYHEQREAGIMLVKVRDVIAKTKIRKDEKTFKAPEDHYGFIFTLSAYLIQEQLNTKSKENLHKELFLNVINPHIDSLIFNLTQSNDPIYSHVGEMLHNFMEFERSYLEVSKVS
jgi:TorA maturation chaperone TorD